MLRSLIILASWITPGILLFLYLLWVSKRRAKGGAELESQATQPPSSHFTEGDSSKQERPVVEAPPRKTTR